MPESYRERESLGTDFLRRFAKQRWRILLAWWWSKRMCVHFLLQELKNYNMLLYKHQQENVGSHEKKIAHVQGQRRRPSKTVEGVKSHLESNSIPTIDAWRAQIKPYAHQDPETPQRLNQTHVWDPCLTHTCGVMGQQWPAAGAGALGAATWSHRLSWRSPLTPP